VRKNVIESYNAVCEKIFSKSLDHMDHLEKMTKAINLIKENKILFVAHYYTDPMLQKIAEETGGIVSDSLEIAKFCKSHPAKTVILAGVYFMAETIKILCPDKKIIILTKNSQCSLDLGCPVDEFRSFKKQHPDRTVIAYVNTSAAVKSEADWVVTSRIAMAVVQQLAARGERLLWAPDKHMGQYLLKNTGADMVLWDGSCIVHDSFKSSELKKLKYFHAGAAVLAHPEAPLAVLEMADFVGSTKGIIDAAVRLPNEKFIIATDDGLFYKLSQLAPDKEFIRAPSGGVGASCKSCAHCPWMELNELSLLLDALEGRGGDEINLCSELIRAASLPLLRMLDFYEKENSL